MGLGDFPLTERILGYWDRADVEIDLVAVSEEERRIRFGTCKRNPERLPGNIDALQRSASRFLTAHKRFKGWQVEYVAIAPGISDALKRGLQGRGVIAQSIADMTREM